MFLMFFGEGGIFEFFVIFGLFGLLRLSEIYGIFRIFGIFVIFSNIGTSVLSGICLDVLDV